MNVLPDETREVDRMLQAIRWLFTARYPRLRRTFPLVGFSASSMIDCSFLIGRDAYCCYVEGEYIIPVELPYDKGGGLRIIGYASMWNGFSFLPLSIENLVK